MSVSFWGFIGLAFSGMWTDVGAIRSLQDHDSIIRPRMPSGHWVDTWTAMPQLTEYANLPPSPFNQTNLTFPNTTIRQTLHMSVGGEHVRLRFSNAFGGADLPITAVSIARPFNGSVGVGSIQQETLQNITFGGNRSIIIPDQSQAVSDAVSITVEPQSMLTVTIYLATGQTTNYITSHPGSRTTSWWTFGDEVDATNLTITNATEQSGQHWYFLSAIEIWAPSQTRAFGIVGDSITDGRGSDTDMNNRWPDLVLARMQNESTTRDIAVVNQAAGGNRILADGLGPNAISRIDRDILAQSGIRYAMIFEGVNDIGVADPDPASQEAIGDRLIQAYKQIILRVHTFGIPIFGATITPFGSYNTTLQPYSNPEREKTRQRVNQWIRLSGAFDYVIDFDAVVRDPDNVTMLNPTYDSGDELHPNVMGYTAMANAFPLQVFSDFADGVDGFE